MTLCNILITRCCKDKNHTAAIDGTSDPGDPWKTSIPSINVGSLETKGMECKYSVDRLEFNPSSCKKAIKAYKKSYFQSESQLIRETSATSFSIFLYVSFVIPLH